MDEYYTEDTDSYSSIIDEDDLFFEDDIEEQEEVVEDFDEESFIPKLKPVPVRYPLQIYHENVIKNSDITVPLWASFKKEKTTDMIALKIPNFRKLSLEENINMEIAKATARFKMSKLKKSNIAKPSTITPKFCLSITKGVKCPNYLCRYAHHYNQIEKCTNMAKCKVEKIFDDFYINNPSVTFRCLFRHQNECIESYILRLELVITSCKQLVVELPKEVINDYLERLLIKAKKCLLDKIIFKVENKLEVINNDNIKEEDPEWFSFDEKKCYWTF